MNSTISHTKAHLSELLARVKDGETLIIMDRKLPVARVERIANASSNPHLAVPETIADPADVLSLPIGGKPGSRSGTVEALLAERSEGR